MANSSLAVLFPVSADGTEGVAEQNEDSVVTWSDRVTICHDLVVTLHEETKQMQNKSCETLVPTKLLDDGALTQAFHPLVDDAFGFFGLDGALDLWAHFFEGFGRAMLDSVAGDDDVGRFVINDVTDATCF